MRETNTQTHKHVSADEEIGFRALDGGRSPAVRLAEGVWGPRGRTGWQGAGPSLRAGVCRARNGGEKRVVEQAVGDARGTSITCSTVLASDRTDPDGGASLDFCWMSCSSLAGWLVLYVGTDRVYCLYWRARLSAKRE